GDLEEDVAKRAVFVGHAPPGLSGDSVKGRLSCRGMALALLSTTLLALIGFVAASIQGFSVASAISSAAPQAGLLVTKHVGYAIPTVLLSLFSQSMVLFYFIGTGKLVKEETASFPEAERRAVLAAPRRVTSK